MFDFTFIFKGNIYAGSGQGGPRAGKVNPLAPSCNIESSAGDNLPEKLFVIPETGVHYHHFWRIRRQIVHHILKIMMDKSSVEFPLVFKNILDGNIIKMDGVALKINRIGKVVSYLCIIDGEAGV